jgi:hypothetical protein
VSSTPEPVFAITYGQSGHRKTTDCLFAFPNALFICDKGAISPWREHVGIPFQPAHVTTAKSIRDGTSLILQEGKNKKWGAVVVDDFSLRADVTMAEADKLYPKGGLQMWGWVRDELLAFRGAARDMGMHVILNCHTRPAHQHERKGYIKGGPALPGTMPEDMPKSCDLVLRVREEPGYPAWPFLYSADERSGDWVEKDRFGVVPISTKYAPMNLGELLRRRFGVEGPLGIAYPRGLEWMGKVVSQVAKRLAGTTLGSPEQKAIFTAFRPLIEAKYTHDERLIFWIFRDARDRVVLEQEHAKGRLVGFFSEQKVTSSEGEL